MKILEGALRRNPEMSTRYALTLASKLEEEGAARQAAMLRASVAKLPASNIEIAGARSLPVDEESRLETVDVSLPGVSDFDLVLHPYVHAQVETFLDGVRNYDRWAEAGVAVPNRLLLFGPPGTGKTSIANLIAASLGLPLLTTRSDTLVSSLLGQTSKNIRQVFDYADSRPCVLFLDEFDALAKDRADAREIGELQRVVIALLQNMDALSPQTILVAATNHEALLDSAVWRRFETTVRVDLPDLLERESIWRLKLGSIRVSERDIRTLATESDGLSGAAIQTAAYDIVRDQIRGNQTEFSLARAMRRLARVLWYDSYRVFNDDRSEMKALRAWKPNIFTLRVMSELFSVSVRQATTATRGQNDAGSGPDTSAAV